MDAHPQPKLKRRLKIVLAVSLALNLLFIGLMAGAFYRHGGKDAAPAPSLRSYATPYVRALPRAQRAALNKALRAENILPNKAQRRAFYQDVLAALRADTFDPASITAAMAAQREAVTGAQAGAQMVWLTLVSEMTAAERSAYADALEERLKRRPRRKR
jgi:uncharacterized membrane protein